MYYLIWSIYNFVIYISDTQHKDNIYVEIVDQHSSNDISPDIWTGT